MAKINIRLNEEEARYLGIKPKPKPNEGNPKYTITIDQNYQLEDYRQRQKLTIKGTSTLTDNEGNVKLEWVKRDISKEQRLENLRIAIEELNSNIEPCKPKPSSIPIINSNLINQYTLTDYHLGMLAWGEETGADWNLQIAEDTLIKFFTYAMINSPQADKAILANIGDFLHWDGLEAVTPRNKHVLDADTRFSKLVRVAIRLIRRVIDMLLDKYEEVVVIMAEGNHDESASVWLREMFAAFYEEEPRVKVDTNPDPYYCVEWGAVRLFYHHGHLRRLNNIDSTFIAKFKPNLQEVDFMYAHLGHLHHNQMKETNLMIVEQHRTLAAKDSHASRGGWLSGRDAKVITYHKEFGEMDRRTINIKALQ